MGTKRNYEMTNELLLASAKESFLTQGFKDTKLRDICRRALSPQEHSINISNQRMIY